MFPSTAILLIAGEQKRLRAGPLISSSFEQPLVSISVDTRVGRRGWGGLIVPGWAELLMMFLRLCKQTVAN